MKSSTSDPLFYCPHYVWRRSERIHWTKYSTTS